MGRPLRLLWIATKLPVPPIDGGRLVQKLTLEALATAGVEIEVVAPSPPGGASVDAVRELAHTCGLHAVPSVPRRWPATASAALPGRLPVAVARHTNAELRRRVTALLATGRFDLVHAEQLHALPQAAPAARFGVPVVLRAQNVESDLWLAAAEHLPTPWRGAARWEASRLARWEGRAVADVSRVVALTRKDARRLAELASQQRSSLGSVEVATVPAPFPAEVRGVAAPLLGGSPPVVVLATGDWPPNRDSRRFAVEEMWPEIHRRLPEAVLHVFGGTGPSPQQVVHHPPPERSGDVFAAGSVLVVPLRIASGVRMKILEAWARGVPVVATPEAAAGLEGQERRGLLIGGGAEELAAAVARLGSEPELRREVVTGGRAILAAHHDPVQVARRLIELYRQAAEPVPAGRAR